MEGWKLKLSGLMAAFLLAGCVSQQTTNFDKTQAAKARVELALGYLQQDNLPQAKLNLDRAQSYAPDYYLVHLAEAEYYRRQGDNQLARSAFESALKLDSTQGDSYNNYGAFLCSQGEINAAFGAFEQALIQKNYYRQADTLENMALCAKAAGENTRFQEALKQLQKIDAARAQNLLSGK